jgi:hypothetical protein
MVRLVTSESPCLIFPQGRRPAVCLAQAEGLGNKTITNLQGRRPAVARPPERQISSRDDGPSGYVGITVFNVPAGPKARRLPSPGRRPGKQDDNKPAGPKARSFASTKKTITPCHNRTLKFGYTSFFRRKIDGHSFGKRDFALRCFACWPTKSRDADVLALRWEATSTMCICWPVCRGPSRLRTSSNK